MASAAVTLVGRSVERQWRQQDDPVGPDGLVLPPGEQHMVETDDGAKLAVTICGPPGGMTAPATPATRTDRPTVVLSHCWTGTRLMWAPVARRLVDAGHRVVLYDQRGHGESTFGADDVPVDVEADADVVPDAQVDAGSASAPSPSAVRLGESTRPSLTLSRFGDDLATVLAHVDARSAVVAGHSMGGFATMAFACQHPDELARRVRGLVLVSTAAHGLGAGLFTELACRLLGSGLPARALERPHVGLFIMRGIVGGRRPCYRHLAVSRDLFLATRPEVTAACFASFADMDLRSALAAVEVRSTVMIGSRDTLTPPALSRAIVDSLPSARLDLLEDAGHLLPLEAPDAVAAAITDLAV